MSLADYLQLLDWTARQTVAGKRGSTPIAKPPILDRLSIAPATWRALVGDFGRLFYHVAGKPQTVDNCRSRVTQRRFRVRRRMRQVMAPAA